MRPGSVYIRKYIRNIRLEENINRKTSVTWSINIQFGLALYSIQRVPWYPSVQMVSLESSFLSKAYCRHKLRGYDEDTQGDNPWYTFLIIVPFPLQIYITDVIDM
jgi:hypothetical protein